MSRALVTSLGAAALLGALDYAGFDGIAGGPSKTELADRRAREAARRAREAYENPPEGESRQVRRARERKMRSPNP